MNLLFAHNIPHDLPEDGGGGCRLESLHSDSRSTPCESCALLYKSTDKPAMTVCLLWAHDDDELPLLVLRVFGGGGGAEFHLTPIHPLRARRSTLHKLCAASTVLDIPSAFRPLLRLNRIQSSPMRQVPENRPEERRLSSKQINPRSNSTQINCSTDNEQGLWQRPW